VVCVEIRSSRISPADVLEEDVAYLAMLVRTLSIEHGEAWVEAPVGGSALLCARGVNPEELRRLIESGTRVVKVVGQRRDAQGRCRVAYYEPGRLADALSKAPPGALVVALKPLGEEAEALERLGFRVVDLSKLLTIRARVEALRRLSASGRPLVLVDPVDMPDRFIEALGVECLALIRASAGGGATT
jgi:hypothetical protein